MKNCLLPLLLPLLALSCNAAGQASPALKTPETSRLFRKHVDPQSGIVSCILETRVAENQQSLYFTQKSMTEDGRFIVFDVSGGERGNQKYFAMIDLLKDEMWPLEIRGGIPFLDTDSAILYWFEPGGLYKIDLRAASRPPEKLCDIPRRSKQRGRTCNVMRLT